ncbi:MAG: DUF2125 domain-containing protein [Pseudomonadota bacterium]
MRKLLTLIIVVAAVWAGYWVIGSTGHKAAVTKWMDDRRAEGWQVEYSDHVVRGFPNRFDTTLTDLQLTDPETGISWQAPFFQVLSLSYKPNHLIAVWPAEQIFATPHGKLSVRSETMRASLVVKPSTALELDRATVEMAGASVTSSDGWTASFDRLNAAIRNAPATASTYDVVVDIATLLPGEQFRRIIDQGGTLPNQIEALKLDVQAELAGPLNRRALETRRPDVAGLKVNVIRGTWGQLDLRAKGEMEVRDAKPEGELAITAKNWRDMLALAVQAGAVEASAASAAEFGLGLLANASGNPNALDATLRFSSGATFLGPLPIGPAPEIRLP